jgi:hypothetical protein
MSMESLSLLLALQNLPKSDDASDLSFREIRNKFLEMDRDHWSIETSVGLEAALMGLFESRNVPDDIQEAYHLSFGRSDLSLYEHYEDVLGRGDAAVMRFVNNLKGKVAETRLIPDLEDHYPGYAFNIASNPNQPVWDVQGIGPEETEDIFIQVKMGGESYTSEVVEAMEDAPGNVYFAVSREIHTGIAATHPELVDRVIDIGESNLEFTQGIEENLEVLFQNLGIDVPDSLGDVLPIVGEVVLGIRLLLDVVSVERGFKQVTLPDRSRVHALKALMLMSRFGVSRVMMSIGAGIGATLPGPGPVVGAIGGTATSMILNNRLKPHAMNIAMMLAGVDEDYIFYFKNKPAVDHIGASLAATSL